MIDYCGYLFQICFVCDLLNFDDQLIDRDFWVIKLMVGVCKLNENVGGVS